MSPSNDPGSFSVGAVNQSGSIASFSARGPSACSGGLYPQIAAPGVFVYTADLTLYSNPYFSVTGTSFAAPHVSAAMALLAGAVQKATAFQLQAALEEGAADLGIPGPDDTYGYGLLDVMAAYDWLLDNVGSPFDGDDDGDTDGKDLAAYLAVTPNGDLAAFAYSFGREDYP